MRFPISAELSCQEWCWVLLGFHGNVQLLWWRISCLCWTESAADKGRIHFRAESPEDKLLWEMQRSSGVTLAEYLSQNESRGGDGGGPRGGILGSFQLLPTTAHMDYPFTKEEEWKQVLWLKNNVLRQTDGYHYEDFIVSNVITSTTVTWYLTWIFDALPKIYQPLLQSTTLLLIFFWEGAHLLVCFLVTYDLWFN